MKNPRISPKERGLIKGGIRRVFSRSELRRQALEKQAVKHYDPNRPRVKKWAKCPICTQLTPKYKMEVDHIAPIIPLNSTLEAMSWDAVIDNTWCDIENLQAICQSCHLVKTKAERDERKKYKKNKTKRTK